MASMPALDTVTVIATTEQVPDAAAKWPVRVVTANGCQLQGTRSAYLCGSAGDVQARLAHFEDVLLGVVVDADPGSFPTTLDVEVVPELRSGFSTSGVWEAVVSTVCNRHKETIQQMIFAHAQRTPDKLALVFEERQWTYRQLLSLAFSLRCHLRNLEIEPSGGRLAVQLLQSDRAIICYLALMSGRYEFQLVDGHPEGRAFRLSVCPSQALLCESGATPAAEPVKTVFVDELELDASTPLSEVTVEGDLDDLAFIEYTSGSTGRPKSVASLQWKMAHWTRWRQFHFPLIDSDRCGRNLFFIWYWHIDLCLGSTAVVYPPKFNYDISGLMAYARKHAITRFDCLTPGLILTLLELEETLPETLRMMVSGGEALPLATCRQWLHKWPHCELWNNLATTETHSEISYARITPEVAAMDVLFAPVSDGCVCWQNVVSVVDGEIIIRGLNVASGYLPPTVSDRFVLSPDGYHNEYRPGDRAEWKNGYLFMLGRTDSVVKIRGHRVDLGGVEAMLAGCEEVKDVACVAWRDSVCALIITENMRAVRLFAEKEYPQFHLIVWYVATRLPYTKSGKRDRKECLKMLDESASEFRRWTDGNNGKAAGLPGGPPANDGEKHVAAAWEQVLGRPVGREEPFQQAGGHSLLAMKLAKLLGLQPHEVIAFPTVAAMAARLSSTTAATTTPAVAQAAGPPATGPVHVAVVGMSGRFPGASSTSELWQALEAGRDLLSTLPAGPSFVPRKGVVPDLGLDCAFWDLNPEIAMTMDTAQRSLLEAAYEALEDAGLDPFHVPARVGIVLCGGSLNHYAADMLGVDTRECFVERPDDYFALECGVDKDYLATQIAFQLNLHGPAETVQTACSSSLVAVVRAVQMLKLRLCDYVICGGASFSPDDAIRHVEGMIWAPDGVCRPFSQDANGTINSDGCGLVVLTHLDSAVQRNQRVYATVLGAATNNDGARKAGFSAPSFEGQVEVIRQAHADAGITGDDVDYIEAHGTGTKLGDPLEAAALAEALNTTHPVMIGSVKGNLGHMNTAAGIPGFVKSTLMLYNQRLVPSLYSEKPNELIDWENTPLCLQQGAATDWCGKVAGVSSFGIGGTNAHVVLGAPPPVAHKVPARSVHLFTASAKSRPALQDLQQSLAAVALDIDAHRARAEATLLARPRFEHRAFALRPQDLPAAKIASSRRPVVLLFPGQGAPYHGMGAALEAEGLLARDWSGVAPVDVVRASMAVAKSLEDQGLVIEAVLGHSVGEWAAAAFAGAVSEADAVRLADLRGQLMDTMEPGSMISVRASAEQVGDLLGDGVELACMNGVESVVLAGPPKAIADIQDELDKRKFPWKALQTNQAFHTAAVDSILPAYQKALESVQFSASRFPILCNVTGSWHAPEATTAGYWTQHLRQPVRFGDNLRNLSQRFPECVIVEVGPSTLAGVVAREAKALGVDWEVVPTLKERDEVETFVRCLGTLWAHADLRPSLPGGPCANITLPSYRFQRTTFTAKSRAKKKAQVPEHTAKSKHDGVFYETIYERVQPSCLEQGVAAVLVDGAGELPKGLSEDHAVLTTLERATIAAASSGRLIFVGVSDAPPQSDDITQEKLIQDVMELLKSVTKLKSKLDIYFILKANTRYAGLRGLLRSASKELSELRLHLLILEGKASVVLPVIPGEYVLRSDGVYTARLQPMKPPPLIETPTKFECALVTGGLRGLGVKVAEWLVLSKRAASVVLAGRRPPQGEALATIQKIQELVPVQVCLCDVSEWKDVQLLPQSCDLVVHAAGNVKDGFLLHATEQDMQQVLRPKIRGGLHLKQRFPQARLLGFSSTSGLFGAAGQASYSAANIFLDSIMPTIQWGGWGEVGMSVDLDLKPIPGERFLSLSIGFDCLGRVLDAPCKLQPPVVLDVDWSEYRRDGDLFTPEDPLLAYVETEPVPASVLGSQTTAIDDVVRSWQLVVGPDGCKFRGSCPTWNFCQQHVVGHGPIFPGTAYVALALEAVKDFGITEASLTDIFFLRPLDLAGPRLLTTTLIVGAAQQNGKSGTLRFTSKSLVEDDASEILHCTCSFMPAPQQLEPPMQCPKGQPVEVEDLYKRFASAGFHYGPAFRGTTMEVSADGSTAQCRLLAPAVSAFKVHPASLDTSMHPIALLSPLGLNGVPHKIRTLTAWSSAPPSTARLLMAGTEAKLQLLDATDKVLCSVDGLELAVLEAPPTLSLQRRSWQPAPTKARGTWLAVGETARDLKLTNVVHNQEEPHTAAIIAVHAQSLNDVRQCAKEAQRFAAREPCWVFAIDSPFAEAAVAAASEVGAQALQGSVEDLRSVSEGLDIDAPVLQAKDGKLLSPVLEPVDTVARALASPTEPFIVTTDPAQGARGAKCQRSDRRAPEAHEVELQTSLWALNFRDVLVAVGAIPADVAGQALGLGGECYGEVVRVGDSVSGLAVGDRVIGVPPDGMGSFATIDARWVAPAPAKMTPEEAVSGTMVYATAWLGLHWMARVSEGERVLIHSAAGGVGLAAVNLCLRAGCTVYGTASTPEKRALLLSMGVAAAFDSRNVEAFSQGVREATDGEGVDVILNSLSGAAMEASLRLMAPFGRFIEIGKRDQYEDNPMGLAPFLGGLTYATAHVDVLMLRQPKRCRKLLEEVWAVLPELPKLPATTYKISELPEALEYFSKGIHVGKVLVSITGNVSVGAARPATVSGPPGDPVTQALQLALNAKPGLGGVACVPNLQALASVEELKESKVVLTASRAVAALARTFCPDALCVELPHWEAIRSLDDWLGLQGSFVATEAESAGNLQEWLMEVISDMAGSMDMEQTFEAAGLDSLALISLARRLTSKVGKSVSVVDLYDYPSPKKLLNALSGAPQQQVQLPKVVCLHGFRSNKEIMSLKCAAFVSAVGAVDWIFVNAPRRATGAADPGVPLDMETFEWWGQKDGPYETGWLAPHFDGLEETLPLVRDLAPTGIVGFSQGGAIAALVQCQWCVLFSAVVPPGLENQSKASFHSWDPQEEYVSQCQEVSKCFSNKRVCMHDEGHNVPQSSIVVKACAEFVSEQLQKM